MKLAKHYRSDGTVVDVVPKNGKAFSLEELQKFVGGTIDMMRLPELEGNTVMIVNDNGKLEELPRNEKASHIFRLGWPVSKYPNNNDGTIVGDVLIAPRHLV